MVRTPSFVRIKDFKIKKKYKIKKKKKKGLQASTVGAWVQSLVGELRSHKPLSTDRRKKWRKGGSPVGMQKRKNTVRSAHPSMGKRALQFCAWRLALCC